MRLERAQYEADLAQRRYEQVDPENRLVAASLEGRWNQALSRVDEVHRQMDEFGRRQTRTFTDDQRAQILDLGSNFPRLWKSETTTWKDRKRMLRLLVEDILVARGADRELQLHVRWSGGACEDLAVTLPAKIQDRLRYPAERIEEIRQLALRHTDAEIAEVLNKREQRSSRGKPFTGKMIGWIRYKHRIPAVDLKRPDELTVAEVAAKFGVSHGVVYYWIERDLLPARKQDRVGHTGSHLVRRKLVSCTIGYNRRNESAKPAKRNDNPTEHSERSLKEVLRFRSLKRLYTTLQSATENACFQVPANNCSVL